jgi:hypothetical protein
MILGDDEFFMFSLRKAILLKAFDRLCRRAHPNGKFQGQGLRQRFQFQSHQRPFQFRRLPARLHRQEQ